MFDVFTGEYNPDDKLHTAIDECVNAAFNQQHMEIVAVTGIRISKTEKVELIVVAAFGDESHAVLKGLCRLSDSGFEICICGFERYFDSGYFQ